MLIQFYELTQRKKEIENQLDHLKKELNGFLDCSVGKNAKGEFVIEDYKLQRIIRKSEKFEPAITVKRLEELNLIELIQKKPDEAKIKSALHIGLINEENLKDCMITNSSQVIYVKKL